MEKTVHSVTGDPVWNIESSDYSIVSEFLKSYPRFDHTLSIYNVVSKQTTEIVCTLGDIAYLITKIAATEHSPIMFMALDTAKKTYVVGLNVIRGTIQEGRYKYVNFELIKI